MAELNKINSDGRRRRPPVFVVGAARSGTTLVYHMLLTSGCYAVYDAETWIIEKCITRYADGRTNRDRQEFLVDFERSEQFRRAALPTERWSEVVSNWKGGAVEFLSDFMEQIRLEQGRDSWIEKTPCHLFYIDRIMKALPDAKILHMIRDGRDVLASRKKLGWGIEKERNSSYGVAMQAVGWRAGIHGARAAAKSTGPGRYLEIRFEDLLGNRRSTLGQINTFLELEITEEGIDASEFGTLGRPNTAFVNAPAGGVPRWEETFDAGSKNVMRSVMCSLLSDLGYSSVDHHQRATVNTILTVSCARLEFALRRLLKSVPLISRRFGVGYEDFDSQDWESKKQRLTVD